MSNKTLVFIDGENLVMRYQDMLKSGEKPLPSIHHIPDIFVWNSALLNFPEWKRVVVRADYYTSVVGDEKRILEITKEIKRQKYIIETSAHEYFRYLGAKVYKKKNRSSRSRMVDINMTMDMLRHAYHRHVDEFIVISGDGDFKPIIEEVKRNGIYAIVWALSSGLNNQMEIVGDSFNLLDDIFFKQES